MRTWKTAKTIQWKEISVSSISEHLSRSPKTILIKIAEEQILQRLHRLDDHDIVLTVNRFFQL
jgi:hypothetical protein